VRISQIIDKLATEVMHKHATFVPPAVPTHAQTGTLTASPVVPFLETDIALPHFRVKD
jgi:hypothetical protein